jgi:hypothetical protein
MKLMNYHNLKSKLVEVEVREEADEVEIVNDREVVEANKMLTANTTITNQISSQNELMRESSSVEMQQAKEQYSKQSLVNLLSKPTKKVVQEVKT